MAELTPALAVDLLIHLRGKRSRRRGAAQFPSLATVDGERVPRLSGATVNRVLAAVSSFYEWARITERFDGPNPITRIHDRAAARVSEGYRPFLTGISPRSPSRSPVRLRQIHRVPRPMQDAQVDSLIAQLRCRRDLAIIRLMLDGGLRPGEVLGLHLTDIAYGRRRVTVRIRFDHPRGVRSKSRVERVVDLHEAATLEAVSAYVMHERPRDTDAPILFWSVAEGRVAMTRCPMQRSSSCSRAPVRVPAFAHRGSRRTRCATPMRRGCGRRACAN